MPEDDMLTPPTMPEDDMLTPPATPSPPAKPAKAKDIAGRVLVDIPAHGLKCGDYATLPAVLAKSLADTGQFDPQAPRPE